MSKKRSKKSTSSWDNSGRPKSKIFYKTEALYRDSLKEYVKEKHNLAPEAFNAANLICDINIVKKLLTEMGVNLSDPEIDQSYMRKMCALPTEDLLMIVDEYKKQIQWRAPTTIDRILTELLERSIDVEDNNG